MKSNALIQTSAPGSLMLFGEHAVLRGFPAIACAVQATLTVKLQPIASRRIHIVAPNLNVTYESSLDAFQPHDKIKFVLAAIAPYVSQIPTGFELHIESNTKETLGLGTSAAVTAAVHRAFFEWLQREPSIDALFQAGLSSIRSVQGMGSGTDLAASLAGGVVYYAPNTRLIERIAEHLPLTIVYQGYKTPTKTVAAMVDDFSSQHREASQLIFNMMGEITTLSKAAIQAKDLKRTGTLMNIFAGLQNSIGVSPPLTEEILFQLRAQPSLHGAKISGSGLGDCVIGLGAGTYSPTEKQREAGVVQLSMNTSNIGVCIY